jgi:NAD(P)H-nitrite reductase large subunit
MINKTTTRYAVKVSNDMKVGRDISKVDWEAICKACPSVKAWLTMKRALQKDPSCHFYVFNSRQNCILQPDSTHCANPSEEEGLYNAHRLNFIAAIHKAFNVKIYYLSIGGVTAMQTIIDNLNQAFFDGTAACYHMSNISR